MVEKTYLEICAKALNDSVLIHQLGISTIQLIVVLESMVCKFKLYINRFKAGTNLE